MATLYWGGGTGTWDTTTVTHWYTDFARTTLASAAPTSADDVIFDSASGSGTITLSVLISIASINTTGSSFTFTGTTNPNITISGNMILSATTTWSVNGTTITGNSTVSLNGVAIANAFTINAPGATVQLGSSTGTISTFTFSAGSFVTNNYNITATTITVSGSGTKVLDVGSGIINANSGWTYSGSNLTINPFTGAISLVAGGATPRTFAGGNATYPGPVGIGTATGGTGAITITGSNTFETVFCYRTGASTISFTAGTTQTMTNWRITGTAGNLVTINSVSAGTRATLSITNKYSVDYLVVQDIASSNTSPVTFWAGANSTNLGNNTGVAFASGASQAAYILTSGTSFTAPSDWNSYNNQIHLIGGGGGGSGSGLATGQFRAAGGGGGGGAYTKLSNVVLTPNTAYTIAVGLGGTAGLLINVANTTSTAGNGGPTTFNDGTNTYTANGGVGGSISTVTPSSTGGAGGTAQSIAGLITAAFAGGQGGAGGTNVASNPDSSGGGGGAGGPNGNGGNGGNGITTASGNTLQGGGGGGNGGGSAGGIGVAGATFGGGAGGNNSLGTGGGSALLVAGLGNAGTNGGGGSGAAGSAGATGGAGGNGSELLGGIGSGGGAGGAGNTTNTAASGLYGGGGAGSGNATGTAFNGAVGAQGAIIIIYSTIPTVTARLTFDGNLQVNTPVTGTIFNEISRSTIGVDPNNFYAVEFDEVTKPSVPMRYLPTGNVQVVGIFDETSTLT